jgi:cytochrome c oxidase subunit 4
MSEHNHEPSESTDAGHDDHGLAHIVPVRVLVGVFLALMVLTVITVAVTAFDFGDLNLWVAMIIATVKACLVALYFMHLRYDAPFNGFIFVVAMAFLALFLIITMMDTIQYTPDVESWREAFPE